MIVIIDYDVGNIKAVENMLLRIGVKSKISANEQDILNAKGIILPGNGAYDSCVRNLRASNLIPVLNKKVLMDKTPILGICVGAQMLGNSSEEGEEEGLGWLDMTVHRFPKSSEYKTPHMGWNEIEINKNTKNPFVSRLADDSRYYFVHSYYMKPENETNVIMTTNYSLNFASAVGSENIFGVQFHPEKSHRFGKELLKAFASICDASG